jgi:predicted nucleic acid-binding protein
MDATTKPQPRWFHLTPGRCLAGLLAVEVLLWLSERIGWLGWHKGYAVLTGVAVMGVAMLLMLVAESGSDLSLTLMLMLKHAKVRIKTMDLKIASIALTSDATLLTRNTSELDN